MQFIAHMRRFTVLASVGILAGLSLQPSANAATSIVPIGATGWNLDAIWANSEAFPGFTSPGNLPQIGYYETGPTHFTNQLGLTSSVFTSAANSSANFQIPSFTANNALDLGISTATGTLSLTTPASYSTVSVLDAKASGGQTINYTLTYTTGSPTTGTFTCGDWNSTAAGSTGAGLSNLTSPAVSGGLADAGGGTQTNPPFTTGYLWEIDIPADQTRTLSSVGFSVPLSGSGNDDWIMAISGQAAPEPASIGLIGLAAIGLLHRRRSSR